MVKKIINIIIMLSIIAVISKACYNRQINKKDESYTFTVGQTKGVVQQEVERFYGFREGDELKGLTYTSQIHMSSEEEIDELETIIKNKGVQTQDDLKTYMDKLLYRMIIEYENHPNGYTYYEKQSMIKEIKNPVWSKLSKQIIGFVGVLFLIMSMGGLAYDSDTFLIYLLLKE